MARNVHPNEPSLIDLVNLRSMMKSAQQMEALESQQMEALESQINRRTRELEGK